MASNNDKTVKDGGDRLRERYHRIKNGLKFPPNSTKLPGRKGPSKSRRRTPSPK